MDKTAEMIITTYIQIYIRTTFFSYQIVQDI